MEGWNIKTLEEKLDNMMAARENLIRIANDNAECFVRECRDIIKGYFKFENSYLMQEIRSSEKSENIESLGYGIYWDICTKRLCMFYNETENSVEKDELYMEMSRITQHHNWRFDFSRNEWVELACNYR